MHIHDLLIVGAGPVGLALARALADSGLDIALVDAREAGASGDDPRVLALAHGTRLTLNTLGAWRDLRATPIHSIHISQHGGFGRTLIEATEHGIDALGHVTSAGALAARLDTGLDHHAVRRYHHSRVTRFDAHRDWIEARIERDGDTDDIGGLLLRARLVACAEGGLDRADGSIVARHYGQHAVIALADCPHGHGNRAYERFTPNGPLALLPHGTGFAVVHVVPSGDVDALLELDEPDYRRLLQACIGTRVSLGTISQRLSYPLGLRYRPHPVAPRMVWLGNAAQTLHPVAGQGFNLALRDVRTLATTLLEHPDADPGATDTLARYRAQRTLDRDATILFTDTLVRVFSNDHPLLKPLRGAALLGLDLFAPLRKLVARRMMFGARAWP